jgi:hypothetical protein
MRRYQASRLKQLIFPQVLIIDKYHCLSRKRYFPAFWKVTEESIPLSKLASIQIHRGMFFSKLIIENAGGPYPIIVDGLWNGKAREARDLLEMIEREMQTHGGDVSELVGDEYDQSRPPDDHDPTSTPPDRDNSSGGQNQPPSNQNRHGATIVGEPQDVISNTRHENRVLPNQSGTKTNPMTAHFNAIKEMRAKIEPPQNTTPVKAEAQTRKIGDIPENWEPKLPWAPVDRMETSAVEEPGFPEVDPAMFLSEETETAVAVADETKNTDKGGMDKLVDWWANAKDEFRWVLPQPKRKKRRLN